MMQAHQRRRPALLAATALLLSVAAGASAATEPTAAAATPTTTKKTACVLTIPIEQKSSPFTLVGAVTKPFNATVTPIKAAATGSLHLRLATADGRCPPTSAWADADAAAELLSGASLVQPTAAAAGGKGAAEGVRLVPEKIRAAVTSNESGDELATYTLTGFSFGLEGNGPLGGVVASPAAASPAAVEAGGSTDAEVFVLKGNLLLDSPLTGPRTADLKGVAQNVTFASGAAPAGAGAGAKKGAAALGVKLRDVKWSLVVSPKTTPGISFTEAKVGIEGDIVASVADPAAAAREVPAGELRLRCSPRALGPIIEGGEGASKADLLKRQTRVSGGCPDDDGGGGKAKKAGEEAAAADEAAAAAPAAEGEGESEVDRAVREAYGSGGGAAARPSSSSAAATAVVAGVMAAAAAMW